MEAVSSILGLIAIGAGISMLGAVAAGIGQGYAVGKAAEATARQPEASKDIRMTMMIGMGIAETTIIFPMLISIILIFAYAPQFVEILKALVAK